MITLTYAEWGGAEIASALRAQAASEQKAADLASELVAVLLGLGYRETLLPVNQGRDALALALSAARELRPGRREVLVPAYVCPTVVNTVRALELDPIPAPVGTNLNLDIENTIELISQKTLAAVPVHMYGLGLPLGPLQAACGEMGAFVFDDAAHAVGIEMNGRMLGCSGDAGLLSFNQSKTLTGGSPNGGGLLLVQNEELRQILIERYETLPIASSRLSDLGSFLVHYICDLFPYPPDYYLSRLGLNSRGSRCAGQPKISASAAAVVQQQLARLPEILAGRRAAAALYAEAFAEMPEITLPQYKPNTYFSRFLVELPRQISAADMQSSLRKLGVRSRLGYPEWLAGTSPRSPRLIELPLSAGIDKATIGCVATRFRKAIDSLSG